MNERLLHDTSLATARSILDAFPDGYFGSDTARVLDEIYSRVKAGIEAMMILDDRMRQRLRPLRN